MNLKLNRRARSALIGAALCASGAALSAASGAASSATAIAASVAPAVTAPPQYSAAALYDQANAYARAGKTGLAILNYQRAALLAPGDPDIEANLRFVRQGAHLPADPPGGFARAAFRIDPTLAFWLGVGGVVLLGTALVAARIDRGGRWARRTLGLIGGVMLAVTVGNTAALWPLTRAAVILEADTPARATPVPMGDPLFSLPEGETVRITADHDEFTLVRTNGGRSGWVPRANLAPVLLNVIPDSRRPAPQP